MAFTAKHIADYKEEEPVKAPLSTDTSTTPQIGVALTKEETETLLLTIREMSFKGEHIERVYNLVYKLQQYYTSFNR